MAVPVASPHERPAAYARFGKPRPFIPVPPKRRVEFRFQEFLDEAANAGPHPGFQRIEPIVPKKKRSFSRFRCSFYGIRFHGVTSIGAPMPIRCEQTNWRLRHLQIPTTPATAPCRTPSGSQFRRAFGMSKTNSVKIIIGVDSGYPKFRNDRGGRCHAAQ
jgi:hypothetical protein